MTHSRIDLQEPGVAGAAGAFGAREEGQVPMRAEVGAMPSARGAGSHRSWWARGARVLRNALVAVAVMSLVPIGIVSVEGDYLARMMYGANGNGRARVAAAEALRPFTLPSDPSITPMQAGAALNELQPPRVTVPGFAAIAPARRPEFPWRTTALASDMFVTARSGFYDGPSNLFVLEATAKGLTSREREYLRTLAEAPVWSDFDLVARAPAVDMVGGQFRIPFGAAARPEQRPAPSYRESRDLAYAAVSRAAYYMSSGQPEEAERTLRSIVSFGFALIDNGTTALDEMIGTMIVGVGRDGLHRFYDVEHDPRAELPALAWPARQSRGAAPSSRVEALSADEARRRLLARVADPAVPRGERFEDLRSLSAVSCTNVSELMFGPRADVLSAVDDARRTLARFPSEQALLDLEARFPTVMREYPPTSAVQSIAVSAATVAGVVLHNPRLAACTRILSSSW